MPSGDGKRDKRRSRRRTRYVPTARVLASVGSGIGEQLLSLLSELGYGLAVFSDVAAFAETSGAAGEGDIQVIDVGHLGAARVWELPDLVARIPGPVIAAVPGSRLANGPYSVALLRLSREMLESDTLQALANLIEAPRPEGTPEPTRTRLRALTARQMEVLSLLLQGSSLKEVGRVLGISRKTAQVHRESILRKAGVDSVARLMRHLVDAGLPLHGLQSSLGVTRGKK